MRRQPPVQRPAVPGLPGHLGRRPPRHSGNSGCLARDQAGRVVGAGRDDYWEIEPEVIREAVVNALMHRDYSSQARGTQIQVELFPDRLTVTSPGGLFGNVRLETLGQGGTSSSRNARLAALLQEAGDPHTGTSGRREPRLRHQHDDQPGPARHRAGAVVRRQPRRIPRDNPADVSCHPRTTRLGETAQPGPRSFGGTDFCPRPSQRWLRCRHRIAAQVGTGFIRRAPPAQPAARPRPTPAAQGPRRWFLSASPRPVRCRGQGRSPIIASE
jgi:Putative ATP-dependent DNA helicase recG C-terminal